ncbi:MAG: B12-binding domain-containing radical SAM protein, partial [Flavobacteriales bacterium]|nr:B12-binding domain-containing radical SAM protein [Flavobacteriales bacterium]
MKIEGNTEVLEYQDQIAASTGAGTNGHVKSEVLDCLFIQPPFKYKSDSIWKNVRSDDPPIGLMSLAAYVRTRNYKAEILDCNIVAPDIEEFERYIIDTYAEESRRPRVVGITTTILTVLKAFELAEIFKKHYPDTLMVFGGQHATFMPEECAEKDYVDVVVLSEGEYTLEEILEGKELSEIDGIAYQTVNGKGATVVTKTKPRKRIDDLDIVPFVAYDMLDLPKYTPILGSYKRLPAMMMVTSRGCPWTCSFCRGAFDTKVGFRSAKRIFEEINYLIDNYGIKEIL